MKSLRIVFVTSLKSSLGISWVMGIQQMGAEVVVLDQRGVDFTPELRHEWAIPDTVPVVSAKGYTKHRIREAVEDVLAGSPDVIFGWWGSSILPALGDVKRAFPSARTVLCVDTLPDASGLPGELREYLDYTRAMDLVDGYIHYSPTMMQTFKRLYPMSRAKQHTYIVGPLLRKSFAQSSPVAQGPVLHRHDDEPHVVFTGRGDHLWTETKKMKKDAVGPMLVQLADMGVHVFVPQGTELHNHDWLHHYPEFTFPQVLDGTFTGYISEFDAHLAIYNEFNGTIRRRVRSGLSTRFAFALAATSPIAVTHSSRFVADYWQTEPMGFQFKTIRDLRRRLDDKEGLARFRKALQTKGPELSFEAQIVRLQEFFERVRT